MSLGKTSLALLFALGVSLATAQPRPYLSVTGGAGSYINHNDGTLLNTYNPRGMGSNLGIAFGRTKPVGFGWEVGVTHRVVRYQNAGLLYDSTRAVLDSNDFHSHYRFALLLLWLTYSHPLSKTIQLGIKVGLYAGWKTYGSERQTSRLYPGAAYGFAAGSRFPKFDTFGGQAGVTVHYQFSPRVLMGVEGLLVKDASDLIHPKGSLQPSRQPRIPTRFAGYGAQILQASLTYLLQ
jgi:hypothetical protein